MNRSLSTCTIAGLLAVGTAYSSHAQMPAPHDPMIRTYRAAAPKINDLEKTRLDVRFDYEHRYLYGKEQVTLRPHFYPTDSLRLDAKGMTIRGVAMVRDGRIFPLSFVYDGLSIAIRLDRSYHRQEAYTIVIDYIAKPYERRFADSSLIKFNRGLYFINPDSAEKGKPVQIYTQCETENASVWFPTIDHPDQKTTDEIRMTVPAKYVTLSNGRLVSRRDNGDGTRTDTWKMDLPQPPYLFMMAVGDLRVYHDHWRNRPVDYYLEPAYAPYARQIFGMTPAIMEYFSRLLHYDFPWNKYAQVVVRDYSSGGMENTTATLLNEYVQRTPRELLDAYYDKGKSTIVHELFHQWFGALVTCSSWSNQAVDETFAEFSDGLWAGHAYGRDAADALRYHDLQAYLAARTVDTLPMVRYRYDNELEMFDALTYYKGSNVLNMLRNYLGDPAFFDGLGLYLRTNAFKNAEVDQLRLALEAVSGQDLHWFFDQWYYRPGHPVLDIEYRWNDAAKTETVFLQQTQTGQAFRLPMAIDVYSGGQKRRYNVWMNDKADNFSFPATSRPDLVNVDGDKVLVAAITDHKSLDEYVFQYFHAPLYLDRLQAIDTAKLRPSEPASQRILLAALKDKYYGLRIAAIDALQTNGNSGPRTTLRVLTGLARTDPNTLVRAAAITALGRLRRPGYLPIYEHALDSRSYAIQGAALIAIDALDHARALALAKRFGKDNRGPLTTAMATITAMNR